MKLVNATGVCLTALVFDETQKKILFQENFCSGAQLDVCVNEIHVKNESHFEKKVILFHEDKNGDNAFEVKKGSPAKIPSIFHSNIVFLVYHFKDDITEDLHWNIYKKTQFWVFLIA